MEKIKNVQELLYLKTDSQINHTVYQNDLLKETLEIMKEYKIGSIAVLDEDNKIVGIFSERDILKHCFENGKFIDIENRAINEFMTYAPHTVYPSDSLASCVATFLMAKSRHIPVVDEENHLIGMLSIKDVFEGLSYILQRELLDDQNEVSDGRSEDPNE